MGKQASWIAAGVAVLAFTVGGLRLRSQGSSEPGVKELKAILKTFDFKPGEKYAEFKQGDRVAQFGLGALIVGGAAAVATKTGLWKSLLVALAAGWKLVAAVAVALFAGLARLWRRKST